MRVYEKCCHCLGTRSRIMWCWPLCPGCVAGRRSWSGQPVNSSFKNVISFLYGLKSSITHTWTCIHYPTWRLVLWDKKNTVMISNSFLVLSLFGLCQDQQIWSNLYFWRKKTFAGLVCLRSSFYPDKFKYYTITIFNNDPSLLKNTRNL